MPPGGLTRSAQSFSALAEHYLAWKDPYPSTIDDVVASLGKPAEAVTEQGLLTTGLLSRTYLYELDPRRCTLKNP